MQFRAISIDPPVPYERTSGQGVANKAYTLMTWQDLKDLGPLIKAVAAPDCAIFLWTCPPLLMETVDMVKAWGFQYKTKAFTWVKCYRDGGMYVGLGSYTRANSEDVWLLSNGTPKRKSKNVLQVAMTREETPEVETIIAPIQKHSKKPEVIQDRIEALVDGPYLELFARRQRAGWVTVGNELDGLDIREALYRLASDAEIPQIGRPQHSMFDLFNEAA